MYRNITKHLFIVLSGMSVIGLAGQLQAEEVTAEASAAVPGTTESKVSETVTTTSPSGSSTATATVEVSTSESTSPAPAQNVTVSEPKFPQRPRQMNRGQQDPRARMYQGPGPQGYRAPAGPYGQRGPGGPQGYRAPGPQGYGAAPQAYRGYPPQQGYRGPSRPAPQSAGPRQRPQAGPGQYGQPPGYYPPRYPRSSRSSGPWGGSPMSSGWSSDDLPWPSNERYWGNNAKMPWQGWQKSKYPWNKDNNWEKMPWNWNINNMPITGFDQKKNRWKKERRQRESKAKVTIDQ